MTDVSEKPESTRTAPVETPSTTSGPGGGNRGANGGVGGAGPVNYAGNTAIGNTGGDGNSGGSRRGRKRANGQAGDATISDDGTDATAGTDGQAALPVGSETVEFGEPKRRGRRAKVDDAIIKPADVAVLVQGLVFVIGQTRPVYLREAYDIPVAPCEKVAEPLCRIIEKLPERYRDAAMQAFDPIMLLIGSYGLYAVVSEREKILHARYSAFLASQREVPVGSGNAEPTGSATAPTVSSTGTVAPEATDFVVHPTSD